MATPMTVQIFAVKGISTRRFSFSAPLPFDGHYWGVRLNTNEIEQEKADRRLKNVNQFVYEPSWIRTTARQILELEGIYSVVSDNAHELEISLKRDYRWDTVTDDSNYGRTTIKLKVQRLLTTRLLQCSKRRYTAVEFPARATTCKSLAEVR